MGSTFPSIQSFFQREVKCRNEEKESTTSGVPRDGFTSSEVDAVLDPLSTLWNPSRSYEKVPIAYLQTGPRDYEIVGRIVNHSRSMPGQNTRGDGEDTQQYIVVSDGSAAIAVKIFYGRPTHHTPILGQRVTIWATYLCHAKKGEIGHIPLVHCATTIYPGRNHASHITFHQDSPGSTETSLLREPLEFDPEMLDDLRGLMTLRSFLDAGYDMGDGKVLVCVRSIGPRKVIQPKKREASVSLVEVGIFDETATSVLKLWGDKSDSTQCWRPNQTTLLISSPSYRRNGHSNEVVSIGLGYSSMVEVDPDFPAADWLRRNVAKMMKMDSIVTPFPEGLWDIRKTVQGPARVLFTLAEIEEMVRQADGQSLDFTGKINVVILGVNFIDLWRDAKTYCNECCGIPLYANIPFAVCKDCGVQIELLPNPKIIGDLVDESGTMKGSKLVWHGVAWNQLLYENSANQDKVNPFEDDSNAERLAEHSERNIKALDKNDLQILKDQLLYSRVTLTFGWAEALEKLCILWVEW
ncbi:Nucleic acid-binding protein [Apiospora arundinis]